MKLFYELVSTVDDGHATSRVRLGSPNLRRLRVHAATWLVSIYGPGAVYSDGWRFVHSAGPNGITSRPWPFPPRAGQRLPGPADAAISITLVPDARSLPPFVTRAEAAKTRPSLMLYRPRLGFVEVELLAFRAIWRRLRARVRRVPGGGL